MLFRQGCGRLRQVVVASRDKAVRAARDGGCRAGICDQERCLIALDDGFRGRSHAKQSLALFETLDPLLSVLNLWCCSSHYGLLKNHCDFHRKAGIEWKPEALARFQALEQPLRVFVFLTGDAA